MGRPHGGSGRPYRIQTEIAAMEDVSVGTPVSAHGTYLVDLSAVTLDRLAELEDSVLRHSLQQVLQGRDDPDDVVAAFNACI
jgi:FXSXX-COOH protein